MKKLFVLLLVTGLSLQAMAQLNFKKGKPDDDNYRYLDDYLALKEYIDRDKYPNFKLGVGTDVQNFIKTNSRVQWLVSLNFDETVAGNEMKMSSCVDGNGNMNFTTVKSYVNTATKKGLYVYGHTLAWHSQQPKSWLLKLLNGCTTKQEMHDTLVYAMDKWIKGMMNACAGKVKAWDLVNEAISGGGNDGSGNYTLQHSSAYSPSGNPDATWDVGGENFYWQDYMGDLDYVRQACRLARQYGPEDIKLFINDYNLEGTWDLTTKNGITASNKLWSLINWIKKWEKDGVTKIDGIGTQMHISFYKNATAQSNLKNAITGMFKAMVKSGKLVRVSELDMGYKDANGKDVQVSQMTETQHKDMAKFYEWIIKQYLAIVPPAQQWGICQWCATDNNTNGGWRANTPVGIWDANFYRKHVYAGFVRGLNGGEPTPTAIQAPETNQTTAKPQAVYSLSGQRLTATSPDELPAGIYIIGGRKVVVK